MRRTARDAFPGAPAGRLFIFFLSMSFTNAKLLLLLPVLLMVTGCSGMIYEDQGDCDPHYKVRFIYDRNLKFADAFPHEVHEVTLYVIETSTGKIVWTMHEDSDALRRDGYLMDVDVEPGDYDLLAWCGEGHTSSFTVGTGTLASHLVCSLTDRSASDADGDHVTSELNNLYHGRLTAQNFPDDEGTYIYTVPLTKDTNSVHIVLQHLSGENLDKNDFDFTITGENGKLDWDNSLLPDCPLTYHAHDVKSGLAGVDVPDYTESDDAAAKDRDIQSVSAVVADHTVSRLVKENPLYVNVYDKANGRPVARVPLIDYALLVKGNYKDPDRKPLTDQDYLDRQDDYSMVFLLDQNNRWIKTSIYINSWHLVLQNVEIK